MKKINKKILIAANVLFVFLLLLSIIATGKAQTTRNPVLEYTAGTWCNLCPFGDLILKTVVLPDIPNAILIGYHGPPNTFLDPMSYFVGNDIMYQLNFMGTPTAIIDRTNSPVNADQWSLLMDQRTLKPASVGIDIYKEYNPEKRTLSAEVNFTALTEMSGLYKYNAILLENGIVFPQLLDDLRFDFDYVHDDVVRAMMNGTLGEDVIEGTWAQNQVISKTFEYNVSPKFVADNCKIVVLLYKSGVPLASNAEIQQAKQIDLYTPLAVIKSPKNRGAIAPSNKLVEFETVLYNKGEAEDIFNITLNYEGPEQWGHGFVTDEGSFGLDGTSTVTIHPKDSTLIKVSVFPNKVEGFGQTRVHFVSNSDSKVNGEILLRNVTFSGADILVIDEDSRLKNDSLITQSLANFYDGTFAIVDRDALQQMDTNLSGFKVVVWPGGELTIPFYMEEIEILTSYLDYGGNLFVAGQNIGADINEFYGRSQHAQNFFRNYLHAKYTNPSSNIKIIRGIASEPISKGISVVLNDYYRWTPDIILPADTHASTIFTYSRGPDVAGIKAQTDNYKIVYLAFGLEQIKRAATRDSILAKSIRWMTYRKPGAGKSFYAEIDSTEFYGNVGEFYDLYSNIHNTSSDSLQLTIVRKSSDLPAGWFGSLCVGELCYAPSVDTIFVGGANGPAMAPEEILDFHIQVGAHNTIPGSGTVTIEIKDTNNPLDVVEITFVFTTFPTSVEDKVSMVESFELQQNYPNPFNPESKIRYSIPQGHANVSLKIYNEMGQLIRTLVNEAQASGTYEVTWNGRNESNHQATSGVYFYKLQYGQHELPAK